MMKIDSFDSPLCVGLDLIQDLIPKFGFSSNNLTKRYFEFLTEVVRLSSPYCSAYKIQKAFFDEITDGLQIMRKIIEYIHSHSQNKLVFIDGKFGDIENTMKSYTKNAFSNLNANGIVVNPYMGSDVFNQFSKFPDKYFLVLVRTSNPGGRIIQDVRLEDTRTLWKYILNLLCKKWEQSKNIIPIISLEDKLDDYSDVKNMIPSDMPIFWAGFGKQGKNIKHLNVLQTYPNNRLIINSSRGILYGYSPNDVAWRSKIDRNIKNCIREFKQANLWTKID